MRHTLKAFTHYIITTVEISGKNRIGKNIGNIKDEKEITINNQKYTIILRDSGQIQLFNQEGDKIIARPLLRDFLMENNIPENNNCLSTRCFGRQIFNYLNQL
jgi:hypothetical protein